MIEPEYEHSCHQFQLNLGEPGTEACCLACRKKKDQHQRSTMQKVHTSSPANIAKWYMGWLLSGWVEFPWINVYFRVEMDITKRIYNVGTSRYYFVVDVQFWSKITPHGGMRLGNTRRLPDDGIENRCLIFPSFERNNAKMRG